MMNKEYIEALKLGLSDPANITPQVLQTFMGQTLRQLGALREKVNSADPKIREQGLLEAIELKKALEEQKATIGKMFGLSPEQLNVPVPQSLEQAKERFENAQPPEAPKKKAKEAPKLTSSVNLTL